MNPILYEANTTSFTTNGLGRLSDCISCTVQEVINGIYELEMVYPINGIHYSLIEEHRILYVPHDDTKFKQPFEIYRISKPINGKVTINAWHISYRLRKMVCLPFTATSAADAMTAIENNIVGTNPFTFSTDKSTSVTIKQRSPVVVKSLMGGMQGSVIDTYGGEWEYNNYMCTLKNRRGTDTDVSIRYGKNLTSVKKVSDTSNLWTGIIPYWEGTDDQDNEIQVYYDGVIYSSVHEDYPYDMIIAMDASGDFEEEPTQAQLESWGQSYVNSNARALIPTSVDISFIELWQTEEYKDVSALQRLFIGDSVHVYYAALGIDYTARIVKYKYNVLLERYDSMTLGEVRASFSSAVKSDIEAIVGDIETNIKNLPTKSFVDQIVEYQTDLIRGGLGGYVVLNPNADGEPEELLILDNPSIASAVNVIRLNKNGIGFSTTGYSGQYRNAWTIAGILNADFIAAGTMLADRIQGGTLSLGGQNNGNGVLKVYNSSGVQIGKWDKDGADISGKLTMTSDNTTVNLGYDYTFYAVTNLDYLIKGSIENMSFRAFNSNDKLISVWSVQDIPSYPMFQNTITTIRDYVYRDIFFVTEASNLDDLPTGQSIYNYGKFVTERFSINSNKYVSYSLSFGSTSLGWGIKLNSSELNIYQNGGSGNSASLINMNATDGILLQSNGSTIQAINNASILFDGGIAKYQLGSFVIGSTTNPGNSGVNNRGVFYQDQNNITAVSKSNNIRTAYINIYGDSSSIGQGISIITKDNIGTESHVLLGNSAAGYSIDIAGGYTSGSGSSYTANQTSIKLNSSIRDSAFYLYWADKTIQTTSSSSIRYKHDIELLNNQELDPHRLYNLDVKQFIYNDDVILQYDDMRGETIPGFIAEDIAEIYPSAIIHNMDTGNIESWDERRILPPMLSLIQEQHKQIEELVERLSELERRIA